MEDGETHFSLISERDSIISKYNAAIRNAERSIDAVYSVRKLVQSLSNYDLFRKLTRKDVKIRIVTEMPEDILALSEMVKDHMSQKISVEVRCADVLSANYMVIDSKQVIVSTATDMSIWERPVLWTDSKSLVALMQENFESVWTRSVAMADVGQGSAQAAVRFVRQLKPHDHVIFIYDTQKAKHQVLFEYIKQGLESDEAALYIASEESPDQIKHAMRQSGIETERYEKAGALMVVTSEEAYFTGGKHDPMVSIQAMKQIYMQTVARGFKGMRGVGEMAAFLDRGLMRECAEQERRFDAAFDAPAIAVCAYNSQKLAKIKDPLNLYSELLRIHTKVLFTGIDKELGRIIIRK